MISALRLSGGARISNDTVKAISKPAHFNVMSAGRISTEGRLLCGDLFLPPPLEGIKTGLKLNDSRDTLQRHLAVHDKAPIRERKVSRRAARACIYCVQSKQRCSGSCPCERCTRKELDCLFPEGSGQASVSSQNVLPAASNDVALIQGSQNMIESSSGQPQASEEISGSSMRLQRASSTNPAPTDQQDAPLAFPDADRAPNFQAEFGSMFEPFLWPLYDNDMGSYNMAPPYDAPDGAETDLLTSNYYFGDVPSGAGFHTPSPVSPFGVSSSERRRGRGKPSEIATLPSPNLEFSIEDIHNPMQATVATDADTEERDTLVSEDFRHISPLSASSYQQLCEFCAGLFQGAADIPCPRLPSLEILNVFAQLYFEHFHEGFPLLHQATFEIQKSSLLLYLVVAALGSQYSSLPNRARHRTVLLKVVRWGLLFKVNSSLSCQRNVFIRVLTLFGYFHVAWFRRIATK